MCTISWNSNYFIIVVLHRYFQIIYKFLIDTLKHLIYLMCLVKFINLSYGKIKSLKLTLTCLVILIHKQILCSFSNLHTSCKFSFRKQTLIWYDQTSYLDVKINYILVYAVQSEPVFTLKRIIIQVHNRTFIFMPL